MSGQQVRYSIFCYTQNSSPRLYEEKETAQRRKKVSNIFKFIIFGIWKIISEFQSMLFTTLKLELMGTSEDALLKILLKRKCNKKIKD